MQIVIADTSGLIVLTKTGHLGWLQTLFAQAWVTPAVVAEYGEPLPDWIQVQAPRHQATHPELNAVFGLGAGETSAIALALEMAPCEVVLDDALARKTAKKLGVAVVGTVGLCLRAKQRGLIEEVGPVLHELRLAGLWLSDDVITLARRMAGE